MTLPLDDTVLVWNGLIAQPIPQPPAKLEGHASDHDDDQSPLEPTREITTIRPEPTGIVAAVAGTGAS